MSYTYSRPATPEERRQGLGRHHTSVSIGPGGVPTAIEWYDEAFAISGTPVLPTVFLPICNEPPAVPPSLSRETYEALLNALVYEPHFAA